MGCTRRERREQRFMLRSSSPVERAGGSQACLGLGAWMMNNVAAVEHAGHRAGAPEGRGIEEGGVEFHVGDEDAGAMQREAVHDPAVGADGETCPF